MDLFWFHFVTVSWGTESSSEYPLANLSFQIQWSTWVLLAISGNVLVTIGHFLPFSQLAPFLVIFNHVSISDFTSNLKTLLKLRLEN